MGGKYMLGGTILGIFLLAFLGIRSASNWLTQSNATTQERLVSSSENRIESDRAQNNQATQLNDSGDSANSAVSQADNSSAANSTVAPLEEAGTYIQRQKRVEEDGVIANTQVDIVPTANNEVATQNNTQLNPQPSADRPDTTTSQPSSPTPAVPALW